MASLSPVIEVEGVYKTFRVPTHRVDSFKERVTHPFRSVEYKELRALDDVSCDIKAGEFVGIAGRNGSGKTTLLKLLASIYKPDRGKIRMAGRIAPFIELGVGFNPDLAARDNIMLNGVMMGMTPREARRRADEVIEFAELEEFVELKLKNYSSGMRVRLGFAVLVAADADILLIDEVLAVGDASFQQKCTDVFYDFQKQGRTIVLVTHAMEKLQEYCDRAILLHEGRVDRIGDPDDVGSRYLELNFKHDVEEPDGDSEPEFKPHGPARIVSFRFEEESGEPADTFKHGDRICFSAVVEAVGEVERVCFGLALRNHDGMVTHLRTPDLPEDGEPMRPGERLHIRATLDNVYASGRYFADIGLSGDRESNEPLDSRQDCEQFLVFGSDAPGGYAGVLVPHHRYEIEREGEGEATPLHRASDGDAAEALPRLRDARR